MNNNLSLLNDFVCWFSSDADGSVVDYQGNSALHIAVQNDSRRICHMLLDNGTDINKRNFSGYSPLDIACKIGTIELVSL